jgi:hypothetical protein
VADRIGEGNMWQMRHRHVLMTGEDRLLEVVDRLASPVRELGDANAEPLFEQQQLRGVVEQM